MEHTVVNPFASHVHEGEKCVDGMPQFFIVDATSPVDTTFDLAPFQLTDLLNGHMYIAIHTQEGVNGDIRGQIEDSILTCADPSPDGATSVGDAVYVINYVFRGGLPPIPLWTGDVNCDDAVDVGDAVYLINFIFRGGAEPCCPQ
jgi:hypothetical protein